jgi:hypothetical protein
MVDVGEQLQVLLSQGEYVYQTSDYLTRMQAQVRMAEEDEEEVQDVTMEVAGTGIAANTTSSPSSPTNTKKHRLLEDANNHHLASSSSSSSSSHAVLAEQECHHTDQCRRTATTTSPTTPRRSTSSSCINKNWREQICKWAYEGTYLYVNLNFTIFLWASYQRYRISHSHSPLHFISLACFSQ